MEFMRGEVDTPAARLGAAAGTPSDGLHDPAHRDLTRYLLDPNYGKGAVWLVYAGRPPSLWARLFYHGWPLWVPLLLALLGWLWGRSQRFGSLQPSPLLERRSLLEHLVKRLASEAILSAGTPHSPAYSSSDLRCDSSRSKARDEQTRTVSAPPAMPGTAMRSSTNNVAGDAVVCGASVPSSRRTA
ncbi:hypothetical protein G6F62_012902 [Rhizopus arrhizus]|nr:hypothetical protein G6F62_012902 [Rhizopus arrhizus]